MKRTESERFWRKVALGGADDCWPWTAAVFRDGYGQFSHGRRAHRVAYESVVGPIPDGMQLDHLCRNKLCVNPSHLEPVTPRVNTIRSLPFRSKPTRRRDDLYTYVCPRGHDPIRVGRRSDGYPKCLDCMAEYQRSYLAKRAS